MTGRDKTSWLSTVFRTRTLLKQLVPRDWRVIVSLRLILQRYLWSVPIVAALGLFGSILEGLGIGLLVPLLAGLLDSGEVASESLPLTVLSRFANMLDADIRLPVIALTILLLVMIKAVIVIVTWTFISWITGQAGHDIRCALSHRLLTLDFSFFLSHQPARLINIVSTESWRVSEGIRMIFSIATAAAAIVAYSLLLTGVSWRWFLVTVSGVFVIRAVQSVYTRRLGRLSEGVTRTNHRLADRMYLVVDAIRSIRVFGQETREQKSFADASEQVRQAIYRLESASSHVAPLPEVMLSLLFMGVLLGTHATGMGVPVTITFLVLLYRMQPHVVAINQARLELAAMRGSIAEVEWLLGAGGQMRAPSGLLPIKNVNGPIVFDRVSFAYPAQPEGTALSGVSFTLRENRITALIGRSGAGKSTIVNMLCRLLTPTEGRITVGGVDLTLTDTKSWRGRIGLAGQDIDLIDGSIAENIAYGQPDASRAEIIEAAQLADADTFIRDLPGGYDARVGNRGTSLSVGQRQRIGVARALLRKPEILILDEATSAIDGLSEVNIISILRDRSRYKTVIVISHRQSTLVYCEDGVVLESGKVIESGPLSDLKFYRDMGPMVAS
jgi:ATP-binding cassette, subfamily B, bacterial MsbA